MNKRTRWIIAAAAVLLIVALVGVWRLADWHSAATPPRALGHRADTSHLPLVYASDFSQGAGDAWDVNETDITPNGEPFLGPFANQTASMTVSQLPPHARLKISFDLFIIATWDGNDRSAADNGQPIGPDFFTLSLANGPTLLRSTFSVMSDRDHLSPIASEQTYPAPIPSTPNHSGDGASAINSLGFVHRFASGTVLPMDGRYAMSFTLPHTADVVTLDFAAMNLQGVQDESWGVANVKVEALPAGESVDDASIATRLATATGPDPAAAQRAFWSLVADGDATVAYLSKTAHGFGVDPAIIRQALADLHAQPSDTNALVRLISVGPAAEPLLHEIADQRRDLAWECLKTLHEIELHPIDSPAARQIAVAARLLYVINTPAATTLASALAAKPREVPAPGTPAYAAEWQARFDAAYQLQPGRTMRYIPPPFPPEREAFFQATVAQYLKANPGAAPPPPLGADESISLFTTDRVDLQSELDRHHPKFSPLPPKGLTRALLATRTNGSPLSPRYPPVTVPPTMEDIDLPGDWVISKHAPHDQLLADLSRIILEQTGRHVRFERSSTKTQVLVIRGHYAYKPQLPEVKPNTIQVYADAKDDTIDKDMFVYYKLSDLFLHLGDALKLPVIDESNAGKRQAGWYMHGSFFFLKPENADLLLKNVADQTSLTFTREDRERPVVIATDAPPTSQPTPAIRP